MFDEEKDEQSSAVGSTKLPHIKPYLGHSQAPENHKSSQALDPPKIYSVQEPSKKQSSLLVAIRCRPLLKHELKANMYEIIRIMDKKVFCVLFLRSGSRKK